MNAAPCGFHPTFIGSVPEKCCRISPDLYYTKVRDIADTYVSEGFPSRGRSFRLCDIMHVIIPQSPGHRRYIRCPMAPP